MNNKLKCIAFYLPQFHPIPENDEWWGKGFTEWTNTAKAKPLFRGHEQPHVPADLGFYDLRCPETRAEQAALAKRHGIDGFCYYHYWFAGRRLLERPFQEVLRSGAPDFPFCLCWANATWTGIWHGAPDRILIEQTYPGEEDYVAHFHALLPAFRDARYLRIDNRPVFVVYHPRDLPNAKGFSELMNRLAWENGIAGLYLVGVSHHDTWNPDKSGFDAAILQQLPAKEARVPLRYPLRKLEQLLRGHQLTIYEYSDVYPGFVRKRASPYKAFPCAIPNWDNTPRSGCAGLVLRNSSPELFRKHFQRCVDAARQLPDGEQIIFVKSWNEWAEGNHIEPDIRFGHGYLEVIQQELLTAEADRD